MMTRQLLISRATLIWLVLLGATLLSWKMGHGVGLHDVRQASIAIIAIALVKVRLVMTEFMELRHAPRWTRVAVDLWLLLLLAVLIGVYLWKP